MMSSVMSENDSLSSQYLARSFDHLRGTRSTNNLIVRAYKQATQLYLTKRFREALDTLDPVVSPQGSSETNGQLNGNANAIITAGLAPVAQSSKGTRTKVWVFYLSLLHAIIGLGPQEGKTTFGSTRWREIAGKVRDGTIWDEVVKRGYGGNIGEVDGEVIVNLATLLLGHMTTQKLNQEKLESYLAASDDDTAVSVFSDRDGTSTPMSVHSTSPKNLQTRLKILELYILHVLPANDEWDYARQVIEMSEMLDEERKEAFEHALESVKEEKNGAALREKALAEQREREAQERKRQEEIRRAEELAQAEQERKRKEAEEAELARRNEQSSKAPVPTKSSRAGPSSTTPNRRNSQGPRKAPPRPIAPYTYQALVSSLQDTFLYARKNFASISTLASIRLLLFVFAFLMLLRRDLRVKLRLKLRELWDKLAQTIGMGVKVRYV